MPVPGPRTQTGPDAGYRNPGLEQPTRINHWLRPGPVWWPGRSPGTMVMNLRGNILAPGQIRRLWRQAVDLIPAQGAYSWTSSNPDSGSGPLGITRALRYMTRSVYSRSGEDNTRMLGMHTIISQSDRHRVTVTIGAGQKRNQPTVRNRLTSFGSRVPTLNRAVSAAEGQSPGKATQA